MSDILDEHAADKLIIVSLLKEIRRLKGKNTMGKILLDTNGDLYFAEVYHTLAEANVEEQISVAKKEIAEYTRAQELSAKLKDTPDQASQPALAPAQTEQAQPQQTFDTITPGVPVVSQVQLQ